MTRHATQTARQRGVALVMGLVLLLVLTILAVASMRSASLEFVMAGNEQYSNNAFQAAETGISQAIASDQFNPNVTPTPVTAVSVPGSTSDFYGYTITPPSAANANGEICGGTPNSFAGGSTTFVCYNFVVTGTGASARGAQDTHLQGYQVKAKKPT